MKMKMKRNRTGKCSSAASAADDVEEVNASLPRWMHRWIHWYEHLDTSYVFLMTKRKRASTAEMTLSLPLWYNLSLQLHQSVCKINPPVDSQLELVDLYQMHSLGIFRLKVLKNHKDIYPADGNNLIKNFIIASVLKTTHVLVEASILKHSPTEAIVMEFIHHPKFTQAHARARRHNFKTALQDYLDVRYQAFCKTQDLLMTFPRHESFNHAWT